MKAAVRGKQFVTYKETPMKLNPHKDISGFLRNFAGPERVERHIQSAENKNRKQTSNQENYTSKS